MRKKWFNSVIALTLLLALIPSLAVAAPQGQGETVYTVQKDDSLWAIAEKYLGNGTAYIAIVMANNAKQETDSSFAKIIEPSLIQPGWKILIPSAEEASKLLAQAPAAPLGKLDQTIIIAIEKDIPTFDEHKSGMGIFSSLMFDYLIHYDADGNRIPGLAEFWEISDDASELTFHLRKGVKFHDGTDFNAEAVKINFERQMDPAAGAARTKELIQAIETILTPYDYTVVFKLKEPDVAFIGYYLADGTHGGMVSPAAIEKYGDDLGSHPVGTGPWKFVSHSIGQEIVLERNEDYWGGPPKASKLILRPILEEATRLVELETGNVHIVQKLDPIQMETVEANPDLVLHSKPSTSLYGLFFNQNTDLFKDVNVRRAVALAIDVDGIVDALIGKAGIRSQGPVPVLNLGHNPNIEEPGYDPEEAQRLLAEAGWSPGAGGVLEKDGQKFELTILTPDGRYIQDKEICTAVQDQLKSVGLEATVKVIEPASWWDELLTSGFDMAFTGGWFTDPDPSRGPMFLFFGDTRYNAFGYRNPELLDIFSRIRQTGDFDTRKEMAWRAQEILSDDVVGVWFYNANILAASTKKLKGYEHNGIGFWRINSVYLEE